MNKNTILSLILLLSLFLNAIGITWGLPDRWNVDEPVSIALKMAYSKQIVPDKDTTHPTFYYFFLIVFLGLYLLILKFIGYPLQAAVSSASISWIKFANSDPFLASSLYIIARMLSVMLGVAIVFVVYLIAKELYNRRVALFSALFLTLSAGFIEDNHYAKSSVLINFLSVIVVYFCIKAIYGEKFNRNFLIASFLAGIAAATKYNGAILILPLMMTYIYSIPTYSYENKSVYLYLKYIGKSLDIRTIISSMGLYIFAFFIGFPSFLLNMQKHIPGLLFYKKNYFIGKASLGMRILDLLNSLWLYLHKIINIYGVALFLVICAGLILAAKSKEKGKNIIFSVVIPYFIVISSIQIIKQPIAKYIILIVPFLAIFSGLLFDKLFDKRNIRKWVKFLILFSIIFLSFRHAAYTEKIFVKNDIRYVTTKWIDENIPKGSSIEIFSELDWYFSSRVLREYNVVFFGTNSKDISNTSQFRMWLDQEKIRKYFEGINIRGPQSDYLLVSSVDFIDGIFKNLKQKERAVFLENLMKGKWDYKIIKRIFYDNRPFFAHIIDYSPRYILVFKHEK